MAPDVALLGPSVAVLAASRWRRRRPGRPGVVRDPRPNFRIIYPRLAPVIPLHRGQAGVPASP